MENVQRMIVRGKGMLVVEELAGCYIASIEESFDSTEFPVAEAAGKTLAEALEELDELCAEHLQQ